MGHSTLVSVEHRRSLSQSVIYAGHAPGKSFQDPGVLVRALRSALRMRQADLAQRAGVAREHIVRIESGRKDVGFETLRRLLDAMFCDLLLVPRPRQRLGDALAERDLKSRSGRRIWQDQRDPQ